MTFCPNCGKELPDGAKFCTGCGNQMQGNVSVQGAQSSKPRPWMVIGSVLAVVVIGFVVFMIFGSGGNKVKKIKLLSECNTLDECPTIKLGKYEQDNNFSNGKEDLEWIVLDRQDGKALITTKYIVDCKCYNDEWKDITWENCTLRSWLNNSFYNTAFSDEDKKKINNTMIENRDNTKYGTKGGNDTMDNVFCLSLDEANRYFGIDSKDKDGNTINKLRATKGTEYAKKVDNKGDNLWVNEWYGGNSYFWLRSPGRRQDNAAGVDSYGYVRENGNNVDNHDYGVRPALWIKY